MYLHISWHYPNPTTDLLATQGLSWKYRIRILLLYNINQGTSGDPKGICKQRDSIVFLFPLLSTDLHASMTREHMEETRQAVEELSIPPLRGRKNPAILLRRR
jgi:hypothetical protein